MNFFFLYKHYIGSIYMIKKVDKSIRSLNASIFTFEFEERALCVLKLQYHATPPYNYHMIKTYYLVFCIN